MIMSDLFAVGTRPSFGNHGVAEHARMPERPLVDAEGKRNKHGVTGSTAPSWDMHGSLNERPDLKNIHVL